MSKTLSQLNDSQKLIAELLIQHKKEALSISNQFGALHAAAFLFEKQKEIVSNKVQRLNLAEFVLVVEEWVKDSFVVSKSLKWIKISSGILPEISKEHRNEFCNYSRPVVLTDGINIYKTNAIWTANGENFIGWCGYNLIGFTPYHWAYLDFLPKAEI